jgi:hypothetical protein
MSLKNNLAATKRKMNPNSNPAETPALGDDRPDSRVPAKLEASDGMHLTFFSTNV